MVFVIVCILFGAHGKTEDGPLKTLGQVFGIITPISYLLTAFSNPGLYDPAESVEAKTKYGKCKIDIAIVACILDPIT